MAGTMAAVRHLWGELGLEQLFAQLGEQAGCAFSLADAVFAMLAGRLVDPASKRRTHRCGQQTITAVTRRTSLQQQILAGLGVDTAA